MTTEPFRDPQSDLDTALARIDRALRHGPAAAPAMWPFPISGLVAGAALFAVGALFAKLCLS